MTLAHAIAAFVVLWMAAAAVAEDAPGLALAKQVVDATRGDAHKQKMRIVWPESVETAPPEGAEVTLITGYMDYGLTRITWHEGMAKLDVRELIAARSWFYNPKGEAFGARAATIDAAKFAVAWAAARFILAARDERLEPEPADHEWTSYGGSGSHESHQWVRLRTPLVDSPVHVGDRRGLNSNWEHVYPWDDIRDESVFKLFEPFVPAVETPMSALSSSTISEVVAEIAGAPTRLDLRYKGEHRLLLEVCLRLAGEYGDAATLKAVETLDAAVRSAKGGNDYAVKGVRDEIEMATTKLRLTTAWDPADAARFLRGNTHEINWQVDLDKWVRARFRAKDPEGYHAFLEGEAVRPDQQPAALEASLVELRTTDAARADAAIRDLLTNAAPDVRIAAARAALAANAADGAAGAALLAIADDRSIADVRSRTWALRSATARGVLRGADLRERLRDTHSEHADVVETLIHLARYSDSPASDEEVLGAWRRTAEGPVELGVPAAIDKLLDLNDIASKARLLAAIDRLEAALKIKAAGTEDLDAAKVARLRERVGETLGEPPPK